MFEYVHNSASRPNPTAVLHLNRSKRKIVFENGKDHANAIDILFLIR